VTRSSRRQRVAIAPAEVAGVAAGLAEGLASHGWEVDLVLRRPSPYAYPRPAPRSRLLRLLSRWVELGTEQETSRARRALSLLARVLVVVALTRHRAVVYVGADTLLRDGWDRRALRRAGVRVLTVFCGSDARPPYLNGRWADLVDSPVDVDALRDEARRVAAGVQRAERQSDVTVNHPATAQFHRMPYLDWTCLGMPQPTAPEVPPRTLAGGPVRVLHAPSVTKWKGTDRVRAAVAQLRSEALDIDYVEITGRTNDEVLRELATTDLVVDEVFSDALLAGLGCEAARAGCAVLVCGNASDLVRELATRVGAPSEHFVHPDLLLPRLRELVTDNSARVALAASLREFVTTRWAAAAIAERYHQVLADEIDERWWNLPSDPPYVGGWGAEQQLVAASVERLVERHGPEALCLAHPSALLDLLRDI
jgi:hypothetical protein